MKIDLHGLQHISVKNMVDSFIWDCMKSSISHGDIITGNSDKMKEIVIDIIKEYNLDYKVGDIYNPGYIRVYF